jgi:hypothetical protein
MVPSSFLIIFMNLRVAYFRQVNVFLASQVQDNDRVEQSGDKFRGVINEHRYHLVII